MKYDSVKVFNKNHTPNELCNKSKRLTKTKSKRVKDNKDAFVNLTRSMYVMDYLMSSIG